MNTKAIEKIQKLLAKAEGTNFASEAEVFFQKAQEMMREEGISESELAMHSRDEELGSLGDHFVNNGEVKMLQTWRRVLAAAIAHLFDCKTIVHHIGRKHKLMIVGRESNRITAELMYNWIADKTLKEARQFGSQTAKRNAYCMGVADEINAKIMKMKPMGKQEKDAWGIVPLDEVDAFMKANYEFETKNLSGSASDVGAYRDGQKAGRGVSLNKQFGLKCIA